MNRLVILEDDLEFSRNLLNYIVMNNKKIRLSSLAINEEEIMKCLNLLEEGDIVLLDLGLPDINGLEVINRLRAKKEKLPYIIVMSGNDELFEKLKDYVPYIYTAIEKPFAFKRIIDMIEQITYETEQKCYESMIKEELRKFEINITTKGYTYIVDAINLSLDDGTLMGNMKNTLYKSISIKYRGITTDNIKWSIEKCIKSTIRYTSSNVIKAYFHVEAREKVTPKLFISTIVGNLKPKVENRMNVSKEEAYY